MAPNPSPAAPTGALSRLSERRPALAAALFFAGLAAVFFAPTFGRDFIFRDSYHQIYPMMLLSAGWSDPMPALWNPCVDMGTPVAGSVAHAIFYPGQFLLLNLARLTPSTVMNLFIYFHYWLAAMGAWALVRALGGRTAGTLAGGTTYAFSGFLLSMIYARNLLPGFGLTPLALALLVRARAESRVGPAAAAGACAGMIFLGGDPQNFGIIFVGGPAAALLLASPKPTAGLLRFAAAIALFWLVGLLTAGAELLPAIGNFPALDRSGGFGDLAMSWSFHPARLPEFLLPGLFGRAWPLNEYWGRFTAGAGFSHPMALSCYFGAWAALSAPAAFRTGGRPTVVLAVTGAAGLGLALGLYTPLYPLLLEHIPGFSVFRYPEKYLFWTLLAAAALSGLGTDRLLSDPRARALALPAAVTIGVLLAVAGGACLAASGFVAGRIEPLIDSLFDPSPRSAAAAIAFSLFRGGATFILAAATLWLVGRSRRAVIPALFIFADLALAGSGLRTTGDGFYQRPSTFAAAITAVEGETSSVGPCRFADGRPCLSPGRFRIYRDYSISAPMSVSRSQDGRQLIDQLAYRAWERDTLKPNLGMFEGLEDLVGMNVSSSASFNDFIQFRLRPDLLPRLNVRYLVVPEEEENSTASVRVLARSGGTSLVELPGVWPRAYFAPEAAVTVTSMNSSTSLPAVELAWVSPPASPPPAANVLEYTPDRVAVEVDAPGPGWLVLNDAYAPGWRCDQGPIARFETLVRAVRVPAGRSRLVFTYHPFGLAAGLILTGLGLVAGLAGLFVRR